MGLWPVHKSLFYDMNIIYIIQNILYSGKYYVHDYVIMISSGMIKRLSVSHVFIWNHILLNCLNVLEYVKLKLAYICYYIINIIIYK